MRGRVRRNSEGENMPRTGSEGDMKIEEPVQDKEEGDLHVWEMGG